MSVRAVSVRRRRMVMAIVAGGTALGVAGLVTLAAWNDNEWVFGGTGPDGGNGVGTSEFDVQQYAWSGAAAPTASAAEFDDFETNADGDALMFNVNPTGLTPGVTIYAPVALKTTATSVAGTLQLHAAVESEATANVTRDGADADAGLAEGALWDALTYSVAVTADAEAAAQCAAGNLSAAGELIVNGSGLGASIPAKAQSLSAASGNVQYYCFAITLPNTAANQALQDRVVFPAWRFEAKSS